MSLNKEKILALIPARGGSERIPDKNIALIENKPLIAYTIEAAKASKLIGRILVSTNCPRIARISKDYGAEAPFLRPEEISGADSREIDFYLHALDWLRKHESYEPELIVTLYPTSPFRQTKTIDSAIELMLSDPSADSLRSVKRCSEHPHKMWQEDGKYLKPFVSSVDANTHTLSYHLLPKVYIQNASVYITRPSTLREKHSPTGEKILCFVMDEKESFDINVPLDLEIAQMLMKTKSRSGK